MLFFDMQFKALSSNLWIIEIEDFTIVIITSRKNSGRTAFIKKKGIIFHLEKMLYLLYAGSKDLKWSCITGSNPGGRDPSFSRGFKLQRCSGFKPFPYEDPNLVTKCLGSKHNYT